MPTNLPRIERGPSLLCLVPSLAALLLLLAAANARAETTTLDTVKVTGQREAFVNPGIEAEREEVALTPGGVILIDGEILRERSISSLSDMLRYVPGVWTSSHSGDDSIFFSSRGSNLDATDFDRNGIKLFQDGLPVTTADGNNHNRIIDPLSARYAVFARGANAVKYGASTLGGAINFVSPTAYDTPDLQFFVNGGSHGQLLGRATLGKVFNDRFDGLVTVEGKQWDGYRDHNEQERYGVYANGGWQLTDALGTRLYVTYVNNDQQLPGSLSRARFDADPDQARPSALRGNFQLDVETWRVADKTTWVIDENRRLDVGFSIERQTLFHPIVDKVIIPGVGLVFNGLLIDTDHQDIGAVTRYQQKTGDHDLLFGINFGAGEVDGEHYGNAGGVRDGLSTLIDQNATTVEAYLMDRWHMNDRWTLVPALQLVHATREIDNTTVATGAVRSPDDDYFGVNPNFGVIYSIQPSVDLFASVSRLFEAPTTFELDDDVRGNNATLDAMRGTVVEVGSRGRHALDPVSSWGWDLSLYYAWIEDEILSVEDPAIPGTSLSTNVDATIHAGVEALIDARIAIDNEGTHVIAPLLSFSLNEFQFDDDPVYGNNDLPAAPGYVLKGEVLYRHANGFYAGPTFDIVDERFADFANTFEVDSYALLGFVTGWSNDMVSAYVEVRNVLDEEYVATHGVRDRAAANAEILNPGAPLSAFAGLELRF